jgi:hypothetical protein
MIERAIYGDELIEDYRNLALLGILRQFSTMLDCDFEVRAAEQKPREAGSRLFKFAINSLEIRTITTSGHPLSRQSLRTWEGQD